MTRAEGYTLIELLISVLVLTLLLGGLYTVLFQSQATFEAQQDAMALRQAARVALTQIATELRMAGYDIGNLTEPILVADTDQLAFVADIDDGSPAPPCDAGVETATDGGAERVTYRLGSGGELLRSVDCWDGSNWTSEYTDQLVATNLAGTGPLFRYFDEAGNEIFPGAGGLTATQRAQVRMVRLELALEDTGAPPLIGTEPPGFQISTQVQLRNVGS